MGSVVDYGDARMDKMQSLGETFEERRLVDRFGALLSEVRSKARACRPATVIDTIERTMHTSARAVPFA